MAAPEHDAGAPRRRFVTRSQVEDAASRGERLSVGARDVVTDEAAQRARDLGVSIQRSAGRPSGVAAPTRTRSPGSAAEATSAAGASGALRHAVRAAVVAELGSEPPELDRVIDGVLRDRGY